ncbi:MAG: AgmX/PglI C-terminal domain-containing protein [Polyangiaceae bacterium]
MNCKRLTFSIYRDGQHCGEKSFEQGVLKLGSDPKSHISLEGIDRMHAVLQATGSQLELVDLGSSGGTQVNGTRIDKCALKVGDRLALGPWEVRLDDVRETEQTVDAVFNGFSAEDTSNPFTRAAANNPFLSRSPRGYSAGDQYAMIRSAPPVPASEVEQENVSAVEVTISWGGNVLHVAHLTPPRSFYVGDDQGRNLRCDFLVPSETLGASRAPVVVERAGSLFLVVPAGATGSLRRKDGESCPIGSLQGAPSAELAGATEVPLQGDVHATFEHAGLTFRVATVKAGKKTPVSLVDGESGRVAGYFGVTLAAVSALVGAFAMFVPPMGLTDDEGIDKDRLVMMQAYLTAAAEREQDKQEDKTQQEDAADSEGGEGTRAEKDEGKMGKVGSTETGRFNIKGPKDNEDVHVARTKEFAENFGLVGLLTGGAAGDPNAPTAWFGRDDSLGRDDASADGTMWGDHVGDGGGYGGLGLTGGGLGGGGFGEGIGLGSIGTINHGAGTCNGGDCQGFGNSHGISNGTHATKAPKIRPGGTTVSGRIPPEVVQRIVRQNYGQFRMCYENGLRANPNLAGRVTVRFVIGADGSVSNASNGGSDLPDSGVVGCVVRGFYSLGFPSPENGIVTVVYPIMFSPG